MFCAILSCDRASNPSRPSLPTRRLRGRRRRRRRYNHPPPPGNQSSANISLGYSHRHEVIDSRTDSEGRGFESRAMVDFSFTKAIQNFL